MAIQRSVVILVVCLVLGACAGGITSTSISGEVVITRWVQNVTYVASPLCSPRLGTDNEPLLDENGDPVFLMLWSQEGKNVHETKIKFCEAGLFSYLSRSDDAQWVRIQLLKDGKRYNVRSADAWGFSAADPAEDKSASHPKDIGDNSFKDIVGFMCSRGNSYLSEDSVVKYCPRGGYEENRSQGNFAFGVYISSGCVVCVFDCIHRHTQDWVGDESRRKTSF